MSTCLSLNSWHISQYAKTHHCNIHLLRQEQDNLCRLVDATKFNFYCSLTIISSHEPVPVLCITNMVHCNIQYSRYIWTSILPIYIWNSILTSGPVFHLTSGPSTYIWTSVLPMPGPVFYLTYKLVLSSILP